VPFILTFVFKTALFALNMGIFEDFHIFQPISFKHFVHRLFTFVKYMALYI